MKTSKQVNRETCGVEVKCPLDRRPLGQMPPQTNALFILVLGVPVRGEGVCPGVALVHGRLPGHCGGMYTVSQKKYMVSNFLR